MAAKRVPKQKNAAVRPPKAANVVATSAAELTEAVAAMAAALVPQDSAAAAAASAMVALPADCRMSTQGSLMAELLRALDERAVVLDGQAVERIDTAALQLLALFRREVGVRGGTVSWRGPSAALHEAASLLGLTTLLELPATVPA